MNTQTLPAPIQTRTVQPAVSQEVAANNPEQTRYGYNPYGEINLTSNGMISLYVQGHEIADAHGNIEQNPYHRILPKGQLIPFPTFSAYEQVDDDQNRDSLGRPRKRTVTRMVMALEAIVMVLRAYGEKGFTICDSLQGLEQDDAMRIFQVVSPFNFPMGMMVMEFAQRCHDRIESTTDLTFPEYPGYVVPALRSEMERSIARALASELLSGAERAIALANEELAATEVSMTTRFAGGQGKASPDPLDIRLSEELGRELPKLVGQGANRDTGALEAKIDGLSDKIDLNEARAEIERLKAELAAKTAPAPAETFTCDAITGNGSPCKNVVERPNERCRVHLAKAVEA